MKFQLECICPSSGFHWLPLVGRWSLQPAKTEYGCSLYIYVAKQHCVVYQFRAVCREWVFDDIICSRSDIAPY